jgi:multidrug resistance efflux pump
MTDTQQNEEEMTSGTSGNPEESQPSDNNPNLVTKITLTVLGICLVYFAWYLIADRFTPSTDQARIQGVTTPMSAIVPGRVIDVKAIAGKVINKGDVLLTIDPRKYQLALEKAQSDLEAAGQDVGSGTAAIAAAQAQLSKDLANLKATKAETHRVLQLVQKGIYAAARGDRAKGQIDEAEAKVRQARAEVEKQQAALGKSGQDNFRIKASLAAIEDAQLDLADTTLVAPSSGGISKIDIEVGHYAKTGQLLLTFISGEDAWIEAYMRENTLAHISPGDRVEIALDIAPGEIFEGTVSSIGFGVNWDQATTGGELQTIKIKSGWLRDSQRFSVVINFADDQAVGLRRLGGQADVIIYTDDNMILNFLGSIWIRVNSYLSYLY